MYPIPNPLSTCSRGPVCGKEEEREDHFNKSLYPADQWRERERKRVSERERGKRVRGRTT